VLMAADILIYNPDLVPVGGDQRQHVEIARDIAGKFNRRYGNIFKLPEPYIPEFTAAVMGTDGENKMSKSYGNVIDFFADEKTLKRQVMGIKTDSTPLEAPKNPDKDAVFKFYSYLATEKEKNDLADKYRKGGFGYGDAKKLLLEKLLDYFGPYRKKREELSKDIGYIHDVLKAGAEKARTAVAHLMDQVWMRTGLKL